jgi:hypothetical protein
MFDSVFYWSGTFGVLYFCYCVAVKAQIVILCVFLSEVSLQVGAVASLSFSGDMTPIQKQLI